MHHPQVQREHVRPDGNAASGTPCFQSILALTDLSARSQHAVERAARLAADHGALLKLMYAPASLAPLAHAEAATALAALARAMGARFDVLVKQVAISSGGLAQIVDEARHADLVVLRHERDRSPAAFFTGQPVERLLRQLRCPVLVTRLAARPRYIDDDNLATSLWNTLRAPPLLAIVRFGEPQSSYSRERRTWAQTLHEDVQQLRRDTH